MFGPYQVIDSNQLDANEVQPELIWTRNASDQIDFITNGHFPTEIGYLLATKPFADQPGTLQIITDYWVQCACANQDLDDECEYCDDETGIWIDVQSDYDYSNVLNWSIEKLKNFFN